MDISRNVVLTLLNQYLLILCMKQSPMVKTTFFFFLSWERGISLWGGDQLASVCSSGRNIPEKDSSLSPLALGSGRAYYCFLPGWAPQGKSNSRCKPITPATNTICIQIGNFIKESYCPVSNNHEEEILHFNMSPPPQLFFNLKNYRECEKNTYFIAFPEDKRSTKNFLGGIIKLNIHAWLWE